MVASLPCYTGDNVDQQRGSGVFRRSILGLQLLNAAGYGKPGTGLTLDLVYNPNGTFLAPPQEQLQVSFLTMLRSGMCAEGSCMAQLVHTPTGTAAGELHLHAVLWDVCRRQLHGSASAVHPHDEVV